MNDPVRMASAHTHTTTVTPVYHVVKADGGAFVAACDQWTRLDTETERSLSATDPGMRCHRPACHNRLVAADGQP